MRLPLRRGALDKLLPIVIAIYFYLNLLPANSVYLSVIPGIRIVFFILLNLLFFIEYGSTWKRNNQFVFIFVGGFILTNLISLFTHEELLSADLQYIIQVVLIFIFCSLPFKLQMNSFDCIVKLGAILLFCGILEFVLYTYFGISFLLAEAVERGEESTQMYAHGIFNVFQLGELIPRFQCLFREPGFLGICAGLLLFKFQNLSWKVSLIWLFSGILSLSLAFYALAFVAFLYHIFITKILFKPHYLITGTIIVAVLSVVLWDILNDAIFLRIQDYIEYGDNRTTADLDRDLFKMFASSDFWFGYGYNNFAESGYVFGNAGIKAELYKYGIFNVCFFFMFFYLLLCAYPFTLKQRLFLLFLYALCSYNGDTKYAFHIYLILLSLYQYENFTFNSGNILSDRK